MRQGLRRVLGALLVWRLFGPTPWPRFQPPQENPWRLAGRTVFVGDEEFLVREAGPEDGDPVLLIHGLGGSSLVEWYRVGPKLAASRRVILIDHRNHGLAPLHFERYEVEDVADDYAAVLDRIGIGAVSVVGFSMGGAIAQALAYRHRGRVKSLALIGTMAFHPPGHRWFRRIGAILTRAWERVMGVGAAAVRSGYLVATGAVERRHARFLWYETHRRNLEAGAQSTLALLRFDSRPWIGRLGLPVLVMVPTGDQLVPPSWQYELAGLIPGVRTVEIEGARHEVVWTHPERIVEELENFF
ncbi:MAG: alpha/beta fold hydrolase [Acidimicrobiia bacterium]